MTMKSSDTQTEAVISPVKLLNFSHVVMADLLLVVYFYGNFIVSLFVFCSEHVVLLSLVIIKTHLGTGV